MGNAPTIEVGAPPLRWGILGAARIARKLVPAIRAAGGEVAALAASRSERAESFAREHAIPLVAEDYQALLDRPEIEAVYLPLVNSLHFQWALECARAGKHCLVEKPLALSAHEARELHEVFRSAGLRLMEAFMWRHLPQTAWLVRQAAGGEIGPLRRMHCNFTFNLDRVEDYRWSDELGGGALWDLGCYCVNAGRLLMGHEPVAVGARIEPVRPGGRADRSASGWLDFGGDRQLTFGCSFSTGYDQELSLYGSEGLIRAALPFANPAQGHRCEIRLHGQTREQQFEPANSYALMAAHFERAIRDPNFALLPAEDGLAQAVVMDALAASAAAGGQPVAPVMG